MPDARTVIAADDVAENHALLRAVIEENGLTFLGVADGEACLGLAARVTPSLILLDVQMPGMDGFETCRRLRRIDALRSVPIAFLVAQKSPGDLEEGLAAGGNDFIGKPVVAEKLRHCVAHWSMRSAAADQD